MAISIINLDSIREFLGKQENGKQYVEVLNTHIKKLEDDAKESKATIKKLNDEVRESKAKLDTANGKIEKFADALGVSEDSENLEDDIKSAMKTKGEADPQLQRKIERLQKQLNDKTKELTDQLTAERGKRHESIIRSTLLSELTAQKAIDPSAMVDMLRGGITVGDDDNLTFADGRSVKDGIADYLKAHPVFVKNDQRAGAGGNSGGGGETNANLELAKSLGKAAANANKQDSSSIYFKNN